METMTKQEARPTNGARKVNFATPAANIAETKDGYVLQAEMPGVRKEGVEITVENGELVIVGRRADTAPEGTAVYRESRALDYRRVFDLDPSIDAAKISAKMDQGILTLVLPKAESLKMRRIEIAD